MISISTGELDKLDGITSLKIEGRMKRPEYVSAAVSAVKKAIDGEYSSSDEFMLRSVFSRSGKRQAARLSAKPPVSAS